MERNLDLTSHNTDQATSEYIQAHSQEMSRRRSVIKAFFIMIFGFLGYIKGFGTAIGSVFGYFAGKAVARVS